MKIKELRDRAARTYESLGKGSELQPIDYDATSADDKDLIKQFLTLSGTIKTVQGTNRVYRLVPDQKEGIAAIDAVAQMLDEVISAIGSHREGRMTKAEVVEITESYSIDETWYNTVAALLTRMNYVTSAGRGRTGGFERYNETEVKKSIRTISEEVEKESPDEGEEAEEPDNEKLLYPLARKVLEEQRYQTKILGGARRFPGEWLTPDILGYKLTRHEVLIGADLEVVTIEVKKRMSKLAVAEGSSHQRLAHRSYVMTNETIETIDHELIMDLVEKGLGLICRDGEHFRIQIPAPRNEVPPYELDAFLNRALSKEERDALRRELSKALLSNAIDSVAR